MNFPQFVIIMTMFALPVIAIVGHYIVKLRKLQIDSDQTIVSELTKMNRQIAELSRKVERLDDQNPAVRRQQLLDAEQDDELDRLSRPVPNQLRSRS